MRGKYRPHYILEVVLLFIALAGFSASNSKANENNKYLDAVREFADNVLKYGRDTYGPKHTPLFVDGLNIHTHEPVKWIASNGDKWILSNLASQQNLFRTLDGLTKITGDPKYRQAAVEAIEYAFENLRSSNGLLYWGNFTAYDAQKEELFGWRIGKGYVHSLKAQFPYYELMWQVNPDVTRTYIESFWSAHVIDWSNLAMDRLGQFYDELEQAWRHEYRGGPIFLESGSGHSFFNTGTDLIYSAVLLTKFSGNKEPLVWAKRLANRYVDARHPNTGISYLMYTKPSFVASESYDDVLRKLVPGTTEFLPRLFPFSSNPISRKLEAGFNMSTPGTSTHSQVFFWQSLFLAGEMLDGEGSDFKQWALEELTAFGKASYRKKDNVYVPILTDGTNLEGYVVKEDGPLGPKGVTLEPVPVGPSDLWAYAQGYRVTGDEFMWDMTRSIAAGNKFGDIGATPSDRPRVRISTDCSDPYALLAFLELHRATGRNDFLKIAKEIGDNILEAKFHKGFFVASNSHIYSKFDAIYPIVLLHLHLVFMEEAPTISKVWPNTPFFEMSYRKKDVVIDNQIIYTLTESTEPPISLQEAAAVGDIDLVRSIIEKGAGVDAREDCFCYTALHRAVMGGHTDVVKLLLTKGADVAVKGGPSSQTPLHYAAEEGRKDIVELLIAKDADINTKNGAGETALDVPLKEYHQDIVKLFVAKGAEVSIHAAAFMGDIDKVKGFLERGGSVDTADATGQTLLHYATAGNYKDIAELLISNGANVNAVADKWKTPLGAAARTGSTDVAEYLITHGADVNAGEGYWTPLQEAAYYSKEMVKLLLAKGANINAGKWTALHSALDAGRLDIVELLLVKGADANVRNNKGRTPLNIVVDWYGNLEIVELLLSKGADINAKDKNGKTALSYAVENGHTEIVELLRKHGAKEDKAPESSPK